MPESNEFIPVTLGGQIFVWIMTVMVYAFLFIGITVTLIGFAAWISEDIRNRLKKDIIQFLEPRKKEPITETFPFPED